jgi:hypothetical protein
MTQHLGVVFCHDFCFASAERPKKLHPNQPLPPTDLFLNNSYAFKSKTQTFSLRICSFFYRCFLVHGLCAKKNPLKTKGGLASPSQVFC